MPERPWLPPSMRQPKPAPKVWKPVSVLYAGKRWNACWEIEDGKLHVFGAYGSSLVPLRGREPEEVAPAVLLKMVKAWLAR